MILDLFAGPGGWDEGGRMLGLSTIGIEWDHAACMTAVAAGHPRIEADVAQYPTEPFAGKVTGLIASPPCQAWSMAGKRKGELDRVNCHRLADRMALGDDSLEWTDWEDLRSHLVTQPVRWVRDLRPQWVALEEVPAVAGLWEHFARIFRGWGYRVWTGVLNSANYGVPQTRERCILIASAVGTVHPPVPTHSRHGDGEDLFGASRQRWVSMAEALGWEGLIQTDNFTSAGYRGRGRVKYRRSSPQPSPTLTSRVDLWCWFHDRPATTVQGDPRIGRPGHKDRDKGESQFESNSIRVTVQQAGVLQSFSPAYPWQGNKGQQYEQVGNAIPPLVAAHVLSAVTGAPFASEAAA